MFWLLPIRTSLFAVVETPSPIAIALVCCTVAPEPTASDPAAAFPVAAAGAVPVEEIAEACAKASPIPVARKTPLNAIAETVESSQGIRRQAGRAKSKS